MSPSPLEQVILRSMMDEDFLDRLIVAPKDTLREFQLSDAAANIIATGDEIRLNQLLGWPGRTAHINANQYHHSQHHGPPSGQRPDLLPRVVTD